MGIVDEMRKESDEEARKVAQALADLVNGFDTYYTEKAFAEKVAFGTHRTLQQGIMRLFMATIELWAEAKDAGLYDLRNEATVELATKIMKTLNGKWALPTI